MGAQLDRVLGYLDRPGVTELVIGVGRPLALRRGVELVMITASPVTRGQFVTLVDGTALAGLVARGEAPSSEVELGARRVSVTVDRQADELVLTIAPAAQTRAAAAPRSRAHSASPPVRARGASVAPPVRSRGEDLPASAPPVSRTRSKGVLPASAGPAAPPMRGGFGPDALHDLEVALPTQPGAEGLLTHAMPVANLDLELAAPAMASISLGRDLGLTGSGLEPPGAPPRPDLARGGLPPPPPRPSPLALDLELGPTASPDVEFDRAMPTAQVVRSFEPASGLDSAALAAAQTLGFPRELAALLAQALERGASDLHVATGRASCVRVMGELVPIDAAATPCSETEIEAMLRPLIAPHQQRFDDAGYVDLALESPLGGRLRANLSRTQSGIKATFRLARATPPTLEELGLPAELEKVIHHHQGLVVIAGPSGHGKTTTLAALVDRINAARAFHIITVEDPVEIVYPRKAAVVSQREVGSHTRSFAAALKGSLREDPDVIVIGELRDRETVEIALTAAETGHLVLATMSTPSAAKTIDRLVDMFPPDDQAQVRASIAGALRAIVAQRLMPAASGQRMAAAIELLTGCLPLSAMIREDKLYQLPNLMQRGRAFGMIRLDDSLVELARSGTITADAAIAASDNKRELTALLRPGTAAKTTGAVPRVDPPARGGIGGLFGRKGRE